MSDLLFPIISMVLLVLAEAGVLQFTGRQKWTGWTLYQYLQFMLVMLAAWGISWGARFVMEQAVLLYGSGKNYLFFSHGTVLMYLLCVFWYTAVG